MKEARTRFLRSRRHRLVTGLALIALVLPAGWFARGLVEPDAGAGSPNSVSMLGPNGPIAWAGSAEGIRRTFTRTVAGTVTGVKFKAVAGAPTKYLASVWTPDGDLLGWAATKTADSTGWMTATFPQKVAITANAQYTLVYWASPRSLAAKAVTGADVSLQFTKAAPTPPDPTPTPTGTGTPTPTPTGTGTGARNCAAKPSACGYPDASNTGVTAGVSLKSVPDQISKGPGWHWDSRGWATIDGDGAVVEGLSFTGNVDIVASNVTLRNCRIVETGDGFGVSLRRTSGVIVSHNEIAGPNSSTGRLMVAVKDIYGDSTGTRVLANDIWNVSTGVQVYRGLIQDNYIHDMGYKPGDHTNGTTDNGGATELLTLRHNTVLNQLGQTDAISLFEDFGPQANRIIDDNLVAGGGYSIYGGANPGGQQTSNIRITNNRFSRLFYPNGGYYGPITAFEPSHPGNSFSGNVWDDTGLPIKP